MPDSLHSFLSGSGGVIGLAIIAVVIIIVVIKITRSHLNGGKGKK